MRIALVTHYFGQSRRYQGACGFEPAAWSGSSSGYAPPVSQSQPPPAKSSASADFEYQDASVRAEMDASNLIVRCAECILIYMAQTVLNVPVYANPSSFPRRRDEDQPHMLRVIRCVSSYPSESTAYLRRIVRCHTPALRRIPGNIRRIFAVLFVVVRLISSYSSKSYTSPSWDVPACFLLHRFLIGHGLRPKADPAISAKAAALRRRRVNIGSGRLGNYRRKIIPARDGKTGLPKRLLKSPARRPRPRSHRPLCKKADSTDQSQSHGGLPRPDPRLRQR